MQKGRIRYLNNTLRVDTTVQCSSHGTRAFQLHRSKLF